MKTWFITGVSSGFGRALAETLVSRGERVVGTLRNEDQRTQFAALSPGKSLGYLLDVRDHDAVRRVVAQIEEEVGAIDVLELVLLALTAVLALRAAEQARPGIDRLVGA